MKPPLRPARTPAWAKGMEKIGPGLYIDSDNALHVSAEELCEALGVPPTARNETLVEQVLEQVLREQYPGRAIPKAVIKQP